MVDARAAAELPDEGAPISPDALVLALDAATIEGSVALSRGARVLAEETVAMRGADEERLLPAVERVLRAAGVAVGQLDAIVCGAGPGSFTSLRIAAAIAKGIAAARALPLYAVASPLLIAAGARDTLAPGSYIALLDAQRGEFFGTPLSVDDDGVPHATDATRLVTTNDLATALRQSPAHVIGAGTVGHMRPHARGVARLVAAGAAGAITPVSLASWEPVYGRLAEAQVRWEAEHGRSLTAGA